MRHCVALGINFQTLKDTGILKIIPEQFHIYRIAHFETYDMSQKKPPLHYSLNTIQIYFQDRVLKCYRMRNQFLEKGEVTVSMLLYGWKNIRDEDKTIRPGLTTRGLILSACDSITTFS